MEIDGQQRNSIGYDNFEVAAISVRRWLFDLGRGVEQTCRLMRIADGDHYYVYELRIREKQGFTGGVLLMLKAFGEDGPLIAFHQDNSVLQALCNVGDRLRNGSLPFQEDAFPAKDYEERVKVYREQLEYMKGKGISP